MIIRKFKNIVWFILIVLMIFSIYILIQKNIDRLVPKYEDMEYTFAIKEKEQNTEFLHKLADYINTYDYYRKISDNDIIRIKSNEKLNKLLKYCYCSEDGEDYFFNRALVGTMYDTIYGNLNIIIQRYNYHNEKNKSSSIACIIAYSDDMNKIFYLNNTLKSNNSSIYVYDTEVVKNSEEESRKQEELTMATITQLAREKFYIAIPNMEFNPTTIMYDNPYYILEDSQNDITIYYDNDSKEIYGMYIGFGNQQN